MNFTQKLFLFIKKLLAAALILVFLALGSIALIFYGPFTGLRDLWVTTSMTTMQHQYLSKLFFSAEKIALIMKNNALSEFLFNTDTGLVSVGANEDKIELVDVSRNGFRGYLLIVNRPERVKVGTSDKLLKKGLQLEGIVAQYQAVGGINAGGFIDLNGHGTGGTPEGIIIEDGEIRFAQPAKKYTIIGFTKKNILVLGQYSLAEIENLKIRDAVSFRPFLIINGETAIKSGNGGWGLAPRTAIGQTKDGTVLLLAIDGRQVGSIGASLKDVQDIMVEYGAVNAANLDGGASTTMYYQGEVVNKPSSMAGGRYLPSAFIIE